MAVKLNYKQIMADATERYQSIIKECTGEQNYNNLVGLTCASLYGGEDTMPKVVDDTIHYQYKDGMCFFMVDGIEIEVQDLRSMRVSPRIGKELYSDVCVLTVSYKDTDDMFIYMCHVIPDTWLYGSTSDDFAEGAEVQPEFINAAREYIKQHNITKEMQNVD
jgi:hypothetical protein